MLDVAHSHAFAVSDDLRRPRPADGDDLLLQALTTPQPAGDAELLRAVSEPTAIELPAQRADETTSTLSVSQRLKPRDATGSEIPGRVSRAAPLRTNTSRPAEPSPTIAEDSRAGPAERELCLEHNTLGTPFDPAQFADEVDARLQPRLQELALRLTRRIDDQLARALFSAQAVGP
jgi:hypothetical protein